MSIEDTIHRDCCIGDTVLYLDAESAHEMSGKIAGWGLHHSGLRYCIVVDSKQYEKQIGLFRVLSCQKPNGDVLQFKRASDILST